ncbi:MAG: hypothetical protein HFH67_14940 [Lachnospiraceae bacterium]|nr:hypothetical protein [Lachnospiraceae bacterium]
MSADNGVYILRTKDRQIRVTHSQAINGMFDHEGRYIPEKIKLHFNGNKYTKNMDKAIMIAQHIRKKLSVCEYGIQVLPYCDKTWEEIVNNKQ